MKKGNNIEHLFSQFMFASAWVLTLVPPPVQVAERAAYTAHAGCRGPVRHDAAPRYRPHRPL